MIKNGGARRGGCEVVQSHLRAAICRSNVLTRLSIFFAIPIPHTESSMISFFSLYFFVHWDRPSRFECTSCRFFSTLGEVNFLSNRRLKSIWRHSKSKSSQITLGRVAPTIPNPAKVIGIPTRPTFFVRVIKLSVGSGRFLYPYR